MNSRVRGLIVTSNFVIKLCELRDGLLLVQNKILFLMLIESDSMVIFHAMSNDKYDNSINVSSLLEYCRILLNILDNPPIRHIHKKTNKITDWVIKKFEFFYNKLTNFYQ